MRKRHHRETQGPSHDLKTGSVIWGFKVQLGRFLRGDCPSPWFDETKPGVLMHRSLQLPGNHGLLWLPRGTYRAGIPLAVPSAWTRRPSTGARRNLHGGRGLGGDYYTTALDAHALVIAAFGPGFPVISGLPRRSSLSLRKKSPGTRSLDHGTAVPRIASSIAAF